MSDLQPTTSAQELGAGIPVEAFCCEHLRAFESVLAGKCSLQMLLSAIPLNIKATVSHERSDDVKHIGMQVLNFHVPALINGQLTYVHGQRWAGRLLTVCLLPSAQYLSAPLSSTMQPPNFSRSA